MKVESKFLGERRQQYDLPPPDESNLAGICLSGGGIRSATFGLGVLQRLISDRLLKHFDYLSTVSGGGYIGSCLTSLLSGKTKGGSTTGVEPERSPLWKLHELDGQADTLDNSFRPRPSRLGARHQLHHLRTHGEYLTPRRGLFGRDLQRGVGTLVAGVAHNLVLFTLILFSLAALTIVLLNLFDPGLAVLVPEKDIPWGKVAPCHDSLPSESPDTCEQMLALAKDLACCEEGLLSDVGRVLDLWYQELLSPAMATMFRWAGNNSIQSEAAHLLGMGVWGFVWAVVWLLTINRQIKKTRAVKQDRALPPGLPSGWGVEERFGFRYLRLFNVLSVLAAVIPAIGIALLHYPISSYLVGLLFPFMFSLGGAIATFAFTNIGASVHHRRIIHLDRARRSYFGGQQGACFYGMVAAIAIPTLTVLVLSLEQLPKKVLVSLLALAAAYWVGHRRRIGSGWAGRVFKKVRKPLLNLAVAVFVGFGFAAVIAQVLAWTPREYIDRVFDPSLSLTLFGSGVAVTGLLLLVLMGTLVDSNRVSLHYFYRDRLTEAYLKTDARVPRDVNDNSQGMPLQVLRDDEDLTLAELGDGNLRAPYHLLVTALNLSGSNELNRKSDLSDHFIFSKDFIGSETTGYVRTTKYDDGETKLATAMTISAAAVGSAMGTHTFWAQAFLMTVLNIRLGVWMQNPWHYRTESCTSPYWTFWPKWLFLELFGRTTARRRLVNLSDGGHTGDNLGLLPLLRRRCPLILVCDAECDKDYGFGSFNTALRMAFIEDNIEVEIDLSQIKTQAKDNERSLMNTASVAEGKIIYPARTKGGQVKEGKLIYLKSSVSGVLPVRVANYLKEHQDFPQQSTGDQFFDDAQFEAYRSLGFYIAGEAKEKLEKGLFGAGKD